MSYDKHTWVAGEKVTAAKLNNIENGVKENSLKTSFSPETTGTEGQVLTKTPTGYEWQNASGGALYLHKIGIEGAYIGPTILFFISPSNTPFTVQTLLGEIEKYIGSAHNGYYNFCCPRSFYNDSNVDRMIVGFGVDDNPDASSPETRLLLDVWMIDNANNQYKHIAQDSDTWGHTDTVVSL